MVQLSHASMTTGKTIALPRQTFVGQVMSLLLNMLSRFVIASLPRSKCLLISWLPTPLAVILEPKKISEMQIKMTVKFHLTLVRTSIIKKSKTINSGESMEKREPSCTIDGNANWYSHIRAWHGDFFKKTNDKTIIWPRNPTSRHIPSGNHNWKRHMFSNVHHSTINNS